MAYQFATGTSGDGPRLPGSLQVNRRLSQWLRIRREGWVEITSGKVEHCSNTSAISRNGTHPSPIAQRIRRNPSDVNCDT